MLYNVMQHARVDAVQPSFDAMAHDSSYHRRRREVQGRGPQRAGAAVRTDLRAPAGPPPVADLRAPAGPPPVADLRAPGPAQVAGSRTLQFVLPDKG